MIDVKVYSLDGCADTPSTVELIKETAKEMALTIVFSQVQISSSEDVERYKFPGSPTVRINGEDIEPAMRDADNFGLS
ncbi:MAG: hypothetical protein HN945_08320 [Deltaproteobacteria bacterium]|nr:hypothetical protein [Deltaproteobacteria bacterium]